MLLHCRVQGHHPPVHSGRSHLPSSRTLVLGLTWAHGFHLPEPWLLLTLRSDKPGCRSRCLICEDARNSYHFFCCNPSFFSVFRSMPVGSESNTKWEELIFIQFLPCTELFLQFSNPLFPFLHLLFLKLSTASCKTKCFHQEILFAGVRWVAGTTPGWFWWRRASSLSHGDHQAQRAGLAPPDHGAARNRITTQTWILSPNPTKLNYGTIKKNINK